MMARGDFCFQCNKFPCPKLNPSAEKAGVLPHNMKVINVCTIQRKGVGGFIEISREIKGRYYKRTMEIGRRPSNSGMIPERIDFLGIVTHRHF